MPRPARSRKGFRRDDPDQVTHRIRRLILVEQFAGGDREGARAVVSACCARSAEIYIAAFLDR
jgi:hypothetical protein